MVIFINIWLRSDDVESLGYALMQFMFGSLSWDVFCRREIRNEPRVIQGRIQSKLPGSVRVWLGTSFCMVKNTNSSGLPLSLHRCPLQFKSFMEHIWSLSSSFEKAPDYEHLKDLLKNLWKSKGFPAVMNYDDFDWEVKNRFLTEMKTKVREEEESKINLSNKQGKTTTKTTAKRDRSEGEGDPRSEGKEKHHKLNKK